MYDSQRSTDSSAILHFKLEVEAGGQVDDDKVRQIGQSDAVVVSRT